MSVLEPAGVNSILIISPTRTPNNFAAPPVLPLAPRLIAISNKLLLLKIANRSPEVTSL
jgi:hypothetical protein